MKELNIEEIKIIVRIMVKNYHEGKYNREQCINALKNTLSKKGYSESVINKILKPINSNFDRNDSEKRIENKDQKIEIKSEQMPFVFAREK